MFGVRNVKLCLSLIPSLILWSCKSDAPVEASNQEGLQRLRYNNPGLIVELGVGLCSLPMPVDYNKDGLVDLVVTAGQDVPDGHTYFFENTGEKENGIDIFKPPVRIGPKHEYYTPSYVNGKLRVLAYNREHDLYDLEQSWEIYPAPSIHPSSGRVRANQWSYVDFDGDEVQDLIVGVGDWVDYGWDDAFDENGNWTAGPLHGYVYLIRNTGTDSLPSYQDPELVKTNDGKPIDVYGRPSPIFADFDGDGDLDLITGEFVDKLTFFENIGTRAQPIYKPGEFLKVEDEPIRLRGCMIRPVAYDWDQDGHMDLVVGAEEGSVALIRHSGHVDNSGVPSFEPPVYFRQIGHELKAGVLTTPVAVDWNGDGLQDILAGNAAGNVVYFQNLGGNPPAWGAPEKLHAAGKLIHVTAGYNGSIQGPAEEKWGYTVISVADWNNDGLPDIIMNSILGRIVWYENIGTRKEPALAAARPIEVDWHSSTPKPLWNWQDPEGKELVTQWRSTAQAIDFNDDGLVDLVALDQEGFLGFFPRKEVDGELRLMPPERIFFVEKDSASVFTDRHQPVANEDAQATAVLTAYDDEGRLAYVGRTWQGERWGPYEITKSVPRIDGLGTGMAEDDQIVPLRLNGGWAGRSGRRKFILADWTGDGRLDLLVNSYNVNLMENISQEPNKIVFRDRGRLNDIRLAGHTSCPTVVNWDGNDRPDLLIGAEDGYMYYRANNFLWPGE